MPKNENGLRVLVVDDEHSIRRLLNTSLAAHGFTVIEATTGAEALTMVVERHPDIILLDLGLPDMDGIEVVRRLREWDKTPIIILSVRNQEAEKIAALNAGADDYMTKPFGIGELIARIHVSMRHATPVEQAPVIQVGDLTLDFTLHRVRIGDREIHLSPTEYSILRVLIQNSGKVMTNTQILRAVWGNSYETEMHLLRVNISNLRQKIEQNPAQPCYILTESGVGYRINPKLLPT
jgi:two-component system KDP operon response regulator KdpE